MVNRDVAPDVKKGSAELLVLALVEDRARHGYEVGKLIDERSDGVLKFHIASLYPMLYRLERRGLDCRAVGRKGGPAPSSLLPHHRPGPARPRQSPHPLGRVHHGADTRRRDPPCLSSPIPVSIQRTGHPPRDRAIAPADRRRHCRRYPRIRRCVPPAGGAALPGSPRRSTRARHDRRAARNRRANGVIDAGAGQRRSIHWSSCERNSGDDPDSLGRERRDLQQ